MAEQQRPHFLLVAYPAQGHINPALQLAKKLTKIGARVTFSIPISVNRRISPSSGTNRQDPLLSYSPYSDGYDDGFKEATDNHHHYMSQLKLVGSQTLTQLARSLSADGHPVTCIIYTILLTWATDVARVLGIPSVLFWIQPAAVFAIFYHYFHGYEGVITANGKDPSFTVDIPGLPLLQIRDLPSLLVSSDSDANSHYSFILPFFREMFQTLDRELEEKVAKPIVLMNTFEELERDAISSSVNMMEIIPIGPLLPSAYIDVKDPTDTTFGGDLFETDSKDYMEWLESRPDRSVVYLSFGSLVVLPLRQREEISRALVESGRPYLWVTRGNREGVEEGEDGMVVEWCSQVVVLSHRSVGCFVTHCGWNSTLESLVCGVPTVGLPQWSDQTTNAKMAESVWGVGVRAPVNGEGLLEATELGRCLDLVMGEGERGVAIRKSAQTWRERAREAVGVGGSFDRNLRAFVDYSGSGC